MCLNFLFLMEQINRILIYHLTSIFNISSWQIWIKNYIYTCCLICHTPSQMPLLWYNWCYSLHLSVVLMLWLCICYSINVKWEERRLYIKLQQADCLPPKSPHIHKSELQEKQFPCCAPSLCRQKNKWGVNSQKQITDLMFFQSIKKKIWINRD